MALVFAGPILVGLLTDWWWSRRSATRCLHRQLVTRVLLFLIVGAVTSGSLYLNLRIAQRGIVLNPIVVAVGPSSPQLDVTGRCAA